MLIGPAGSGSLLHVDFPPMAVYMYVIRGEKTVCWWDGNPEDLPDWVRSHYVGAEMYTEVEFRKVADWCQANYGRVQRLKAGAVIGTWVTCTVWPEMTCVVCAGDMAYVPVGAWHAAFNHELTVSVNEAYLPTLHLPRVSGVACVTCTVRVRT
jgi:hypothetical protein